MNLADMTPDQRLAHMRAKAAQPPVDWTAVRRATATPIADRTEADWTLVDAFAG